MRVPLRLVLLLGTLLASPALWLLHRGSIDLADAALRVGVCVLASWAALHLIVASTRLGMPASPAVPAPSPTEDGAPLPSPGA